MTIAVLLAIIPFGIWAVVHLPIGSASVHEWLPEGRPERQRYDEFTKLFGHDQFVIVSWDECKLGDGRLADFKKELVRNDNASNALIASVETSQDFVEKLTNAPLKLSQRRAVERLEGGMIGHDGTAAILVVLTEFGNANQKATLELIQSSSKNVEGLDPNSLRMAGTAYEGFAIDVAAEASLKWLVLPSSLLGTLISWFCLRSFRIAIAVLILSGVGQLIAVSLVYYTGHRFSAVLIVLPTLVFMLTLSGAVHLVNYFRDVQREGSENSGARAMLLGWLPCSLSTLTTALGMGSLWMSQMSPVREFGIFSAVGLSLATIALLLAFPVTMDRFCRGITSKQGGPTSRIANQYTIWIGSRASIISLLGLSLLALSLFGLAKLEVSTKFGDMFPPSSRTNVDMNWLEKHLGPISSIEVLLTFGPQSDAELLERAGCVRNVMERLRSKPEIGGVVSATTFLPDWTDSKSVGAAARRGAIRKSLEVNLAEIEKHGFIAETSEGQVWRITAKVSALTGDDYGMLTQKVATATREITDLFPETHDLQLEFTGLTPLMHETQVTILQDLGYSFAMAFLLITPVMMVIGRGIFTGLLLMVPNILPVTVVFGAMGLFGFPIDIAGILTASVALGIAVDDTLHFISWYTKELRQGIDNATAVANTFHSCAAAMMYTTAISCGSMAPFLLSEFNPTRQFATLMIAMLSGAIIGDLVLLPALLLSPVGKRWCAAAKISSTIESVGL